MPNSLIVSNKIPRFNKVISVSGDKSLSIRWVLFSSLASGVSNAKNLLLSQDVLAAIRAIKILGIKSKISKSGSKIFGKGLISAEEKIISVPSLGDHRICMSSFILSILTGAKTKIKNFETVNTSSPSFLKIIKFLGANFETQK